MNKVIVTDRQEIAEKLQACSSDPVVSIDPKFIDLDEPAFNANFEPRFRVLNPKDAKTVQGFRGIVICAVPPGIKFGRLLVHLLQMHQATATKVLYAPLHCLTPDAVQEALREARDPEPFFVTSILAERLVENLVGTKLAKFLHKGGFKYTGWNSFYLLFLARTLGQPAWLRQLFFGECQADEIDIFGGTIYHYAPPRPLSIKCSVAHKEVEDMWPDPLLLLNRAVADCKESLANIHEGLLVAYLQGWCSWPFTHGRVSFGEKPFQVFRPAGILEGFPASYKAKRIIRLYTSKDHRFRSYSYYPVIPGDFQPQNPVPDVAKTEFRISELLPRPNRNYLLERLTASQINLNFYAIRQLIYCDLVADDKDKPVLTPGGEQVLQILERAGLSEILFYLIFRQLENIQTQESSYEEVLQQVTETLALNPTEQA